MVIQSLRWGRTVGGIACGPVPGAEIAELSLLHNGQPLFVSGSSFDVYARVIVSQEPLFDRWAREEPIPEGNLEDFHFEMGEEIPSGMEASPYINAYKLVLLALQSIPSGIRGEEKEAAAEFFSPYKGRKLEKLDELRFPEI